MLALRHQLWHCYNNKTTVTYTDEIVNWSWLCDILKCIKAIHLITNHGFFRSSLVEESNEDRTAICHVRNLCSYECRELQKDSGNRVASLRRHLPKLTDTTDEKINGTNWREWRDTVYTIWSRTYECKWLPLNPVSRIESVHNSIKSIPFAAAKSLTMWVSAQKIYWQTMLSQTGIWE